MTYGGGLFESIPALDFMELHNQFCPRGPHIDPGILNQHPRWAYARHSVQTRDDVKRWKWARP